MHEIMKKYLVNLTIILQNFENLAIGVFLTAQPISSLWSWNSRKHILLGKRRVTFLPKKLSGSNKRNRIFELPSNDIRPLIDSQRQVAVRTNPPGNPERRVADKYHGCVLCTTTYLANDGYITVSLVGRMATGSSRSDFPPRVTHATSGAKSAIKSDSV